MFFSSQGIWQKNCVRRLYTQDKAKEVDLGLHKKNARNRNEDFFSILELDQISAVTISNRSANTDGTLKERPESSRNLSCFAVLCSNIPSRELYTQHVIIYSFPSQ